MDKRTCRVPLAMQFVARDGVVTVNEEATVWADVPTSVLAGMLMQLMPEEMKKGFQKK